MKTIYILAVYGGAYDSKYDNTLKAFVSENKAKEQADFLNGKLAELNLDRDGSYSFYDDDAKTKLEDEFFNGGNLSATYYNKVYVYPIELDDEE